MMDLPDFLVLAKKSTYATGEVVKIVLPDGGKRFTFKSEGLAYQDTYYGFNPFAGQEVVWRNGEVIWTMVYHGIVNQRYAGSVSDIFVFLKRALAHVEKDLPFRGPRLFVDNRWLYRNNVDGSVEGNFDGKEEIFLGQQMVYALEYLGGKIIGDK